MANIQKNDGGYIVTHKELEQIVRKIFKEVMPSNYPFQITKVCGYLEIVPDSESRIFSEGELAGYIDTFNAKLRNKTCGAHGVGGYKVSNNSGNVKLQFVTIF